MSRTSCASCASRTGGGAPRLALQQGSRAWESWGMSGVAGRRDRGSEFKNRTKQNPLHGLGARTRRASAILCQEPSLLSAPRCTARLHPRLEHDTTSTTTRRRARRGRTAGARAQILYKLHVHVQHTSHLSVTLTAPSAQPHLIVCCSVISAPRMRAHQVTSLASGLSSSDHRASALKHWAQSTMRGGEPRGLAGAPR